MSANKNPRRQLAGADEEYIKAYKGRAKLIVTCACGYERTITAQFLLNVLGPDAVIADARVKLRCSQCGRKESTIKPISL
jgi:hypothetical protein